MRITQWIIALTTAVVFATPVLADAPASEFNTKTSDAGVKYITGGVGDEQAANMERLFGEYSFKLVNVRNDGDGAYVAKVKTTVKNKAGKTVVKTTTDGPWLIADLQPGSYTLNAKFNGQTQNRTINIVENGHERLVLKWEASNIVDRGAEANKAASEHPGKKAGSDEHPGKKKTGSEHPGS